MSSCPPEYASFNPCIVIPVYNHEEAVGKVIERLNNVSQLPTILVDDGSHADCHTVLEQLSHQLDNVSLVTLPHNLGKGGAVKAGLRAAVAQGFSHALQIDADGQHDADYIGRFLASGREHPEAIICGYPEYDASVPRGRYYARYLTHVWVWINSLSLTIRDSMCGFRLYPLRATVALLDAEYTGNRMEFDPEIMVRWVWRDGAVVNLPIKVHYPLDGVSHFLLWRDNALISRMHTRLFFGMLRRSPRLLWRKLRGNRQRVVLP